MRYRKRIIETEISNLFKISPIVSITGPRQWGKSTLIEHYISQQKEEWTHVTLDDKDKLLTILEDPTLFAKSINSDIAIDEAQKAPDLFHSLKQVVDEGLPYQKVYRLFAYQTAHCSYESFLW